MRFLSPALLLSQQAVSLFTALLLIWTSLPLSLADINTGGGENRAGRATLRVRPIEAQVRAGEWVDIPVEVFGAGLGRVEFELVEAPAAGQLTAPEAQVEPNNPRPQPLLRFDARQIQQARELSFRFRALSRGANPSPVVDASIQVLPAEVRLFAPQSLDFGKVFYGQTGEQVLNLENGGLRPLTLTASLNGAGWRWKNQPDKAEIEVTIPATGTVDLPIEFTSAPTAQARTQLDLISPSGKQQVLLFARAQSMLLIDENSLQAPPANNAAAPAQQAQGILQDLSLSNQSEEALTILLLGSPQLNLPESLILEAGQSRSLPIKPNLEAVRLGAQDTLQLRFAGLEEKLSWSIPAQPARAQLLDDQGQPLSSQPTPKQIELGEQKRVNLRIRNIGGEAGFLHLDTEPPFFLEISEQNAELEAGKEFEFSLLVDGSIVGERQTQLRYGFGLLREQLPLQVNILAPAPVVEEDLTESPQAGDSPPAIDPRKLDNLRETGQASPNSANKSTTETRASIDYSGKTRQEMASAFVRNLATPRKLDFEIRPIYDEISHKNLALSWPLPNREDLAELNWEVSWLSTAVKQKSAWQSIPVRVETDKESKRASVQIKGLRPGSAFYLRLTAKDANQQEVLADGSYHVMIPFRPSFWERFGGIIWGTLAVASIAGGAFWWFRIR